jgi:hypothetical protein
MWDSTILPVSRQSDVSESATLAESVVASPDGRRLFVAQALPADEHSCCALFALDLRAKSLCPLIEPALEGAVCQMEVPFLLTEAL